MPSVTTWNRLEPAERSTEIVSGLEARLHDPLWLLGRQWQMREFAAEDCGSPVSSTVVVDAWELSRFVAGGVAPDGVMAGTTLNNRAVPLEAIAEREPPAPLPWRLVADGSTHFDRCLVRRGVGQHAARFRQVYAYDAGPLPGRLIDVDRLAAALATSLRPSSGAPSLPATPVLPPADMAAVVAASQEWLQWFEALIHRPAKVGAAGSAWRDDRLEYQFCASVATPEREIVMPAENYQGGNLDWHDFTIRYGATLGGSSADAKTQTLTQSAIPAPLTFPGMPASRWWEFENGSVDLGAIAAGPEDPIRVLLVEFALLYGNDWFLVPLDLPVGTVSRIRSLVVTNSFGETITVNPFSRAAGQGSGWRMFSVTEEGRIPNPPPPGGDLFFLPPVLGPSVTGQPDEEVSFVRDEMANLVWAVERTISSEAQRTSPPPSVSETTEGERYRYELSSGIREHWIPFVPVAGAHNSVWLRRGRVLDASGQPVAAQATLLKTDGPMLIREEEVPREGLLLQRAFQLARWTDGSTHLWIARRAQTVAREGSSGLAFDLAEALSS